MTLVKILSYIAAVLGAISTMGVIPFVSVEVGAVIVAIAGSVLMVLMVIGDYLDDKKLNKSFKMHDGVKSILEKVMGFFKK